MKAKVVNSDEYIALRKRKKYPNKYQDKKNAKHPSIDKSTQTEQTKVNLTCANSLKSQRLRSLTRQCAMDHEEEAELLLLGYILGDNDLWGSNARQEEVVEPPRKKKIRVRPWIARRETKENNTMYKLQLEISEVGQQPMERKLMITEKATTIQYQSPVNIRRKRNEDSRDVDV